MSGTEANLFFDLIIENTLFVSKNGDNATAERGNWNLPYLTITEATADAQAGDTIFVFSSGASFYNEGSNDITKTDVNYYYEMGAVVQCNEEVISDFNQAKNINVAGFGTFRTVGTNFAKGVINMENAGTNMKVRYNELFGNTNGIELTGGSTFDIEGGKVNSTLQYGVFMRGNYSGRLKMTEIDSNVASSIVIFNINTDLVAREITIDCEIMNSDVSAFQAGVIYTSNLNNTLLTIKGVRMFNNSPATTGGIWFHLSGAGNVIFKDCFGQCTNGYGVELRGNPVALVSNCSFESSRFNWWSRTSSQAEIKNSKLKSNGMSTNFGVVRMETTSELDISYSELVQASNSLSDPCIIDVRNDNLRMRSVKMVGDASTSTSIRNSAGGAQNVSIELPCVTNKPTGATITNIVAGTNVIVSANVKENTNTIL